MSFIRPEAKATMMRWREVLIGLALSAFGLIWAMTEQGVIAYVGIGLVILGAVLIAVGIQRGRFRIAGRGPGLVVITEDQIVYLGPLTGGAAALDDLTDLSIDHTGKPAHWVLAQSTQPDLHIPVTADGADALFDVFARLPGLRTEHMLAQLKARGQAQTPIWQRASGGAKRLQ